MDTNKLTLPLKENGQFALNLSRSSGDRYSKKIQVLAGVAVLVIINVSLLVVTILTLTRVQKLENEVEILKNFTDNMKSRNERLIDAILAMESDDLYEDPNEETHSGPEMIMGSPEGSSDNPSDGMIVNDYDYLEIYQNVTKDLYEEDNNDIGIIRFATNLTKEGKETSRDKRSIVAATQDGVVINSESYAEKKAKNGTRNKTYTLREFTVTPVSARPSSIGSPPLANSQELNSESPTTVYKQTSHNAKSSRRTPPPVFTRRSRVMHRDDKSKAFRQTVRKSALKSGDTFSEEVTSAPDFTVIRDPSVSRRRYRLRRLPLEILDEAQRTRMGRARLPAINYHGDTSKYILGQHTNFNGNGHLRHPSQTFVDWKVSDWATSAGMDTYFSMEEGVVTVKEPGIYFIYAQIYYLDEHDRTGYKVYKNREAILQCTITILQDSIHDRKRNLIGNTCYTGRVEHLSEGDTISLADVTQGRYSVFEPGKSFFGLVKLSDVKIK